ncbi:hypothetical protein V6N13_128279 [Hibiscus sabdariffa]
MWNSSSTGTVRLSNHNISMPLGLENTIILLSRTVPAYSAGLWRLDLDMGLTRRKGLGVDFAALFFSFIVLVALKYTRGAVAYRSVSAGGLWPVQLQNACLHADIHIYIIWIIDPGLSLYLEPGLAADNIRW